MLNHHYHTRANSSKFNVDTDNEADIVSDNMAQPQPQLSGFKVELPPHFLGSGNEDFMQWCRRMEVALDAAPNGAGADLAKLLPSRLGGAAFSFWDSLPPDVKADYAATKKRMKDVFGQRQHIVNFQSFVNARPRYPGEALEVYAAELTRLVSEAFPEYDCRAREEETYRRFLAGLDINLVQKCHEHGARNLADAMRIAMQVERAMEASKLHGPSPNIFIPPSHYYPVGSQFGRPSYVDHASTPGTVTSMTLKENNACANGLAELTEQVKNLAKLVQESVSYQNYNRGRSPFRYRPRPNEYNRGRSPSVPNDDKGKPRFWKSDSPGRGHMYGGESRWRSPMRDYRYRSPSPHPKGFRSRDSTPNRHNSSPRRVSFEEKTPQSTNVGADLNEM